MEYSLDIEELQRIPFDKYEQDFMFIINGQQFYTTRFIADLLSPIIRKAHYHDSTFNKYEITKEDIFEGLEENQFLEYFSEFLTLSNYYTQTLDCTRQKYYSAYFYCIGNIKEYFRIENKYFEEISTENVIERIISISKMIQKCPEEISQECISKNLIEFASKNFEEIDKKEFYKLRYEELELIIKNQHLQLNNEDSLMEFILNKYLENREYSKLIEFVIFPNLSENMIKRFIETFDIEYLNHNMWKSICSGLLPKNSETNPESRYKLYNKIEEFKHSEGKEFDGIMRHLSRETGGNIHENGTI